MYVYVFFGWVTPAEHTVVHLGRVGDTHRTHGGPLGRVDGTQPTEHTWVHLGRVGDLHLDEHVPRAGFSFDDPRACPNILYNVDVAQLLHKVPSNPRLTLTRERQRSKRWLVPRILNGMSRERAYPLIIQGLVQILLRCRCGLITLQSAIQSTRTSMCEQPIISIMALNPWLTFFKRDGKRREDSGRKASQPANQQTSQPATLTKTMTPMRIINSRRPLSNCNESPTVPCPKSNGQKDAEQQGMRVFLLRVFEKLQHRLEERP
jgi:hypothetical protein